MALLSPKAQRSAAFRLQHQGLERRGRDTKRLIGKCSCTVNGALPGGQSLPVDALPEDRQARIVRSQGAGLLFEFDGVALLAELEIQVGQ